jgi:hypothetical protein
MFLLRFGEGLGGGATPLTFVFAVTQLTNFGPGPVSQTTGFAFEVFENTRAKAFLHALMSG